MSGVLPVEPIPLPLANYDGPGVALWCMWHPSWTWAPDGKRWKDRLIKDLALHFHVRGSTISTECILWMYTDEEAERHYVYIAFPVPVDVGDFLTNTARLYAARGTETSGSLHAEAVPVLKREASGSFIRLWPSPGPDVPAKQKRQVEWEKLTFFNRCYQLLG